MPVEPPATPWHFPSADQLDEEPVDESGLVGVGADTEPGTVLAAYRHGIFPMPTDPHGPMGWWSPDPRGVLPLDALRVSRSLRRSCRDFEIRIDNDFPAVLEACADPTRPHGWIDDRIRTVYLRLHRMGWVHSVETWQDDRLVGGLYGVAIGGLFAGESMFHRVADASKVALVALVEALRDTALNGHEPRLIDVQWRTDHLASLGVQEWSRRHYLDALPVVLASPAAAVFSGAGHSIPEA
ncbi:MAG: leucyl/phenylalanyl-tRNA--protein transferase [Acidimicrobiales bacterium]